MGVERKRQLQETGRHPCGRPGGKGLRWRPDWMQSLRDKGVLTIFFRHALAAQGSDVALRRSPCIRRHG